VYIQPEKVEEIKEASDIVAIIGSYIKLTKKSSSYFGLCPFHKEKTPSFSISPRKQIFNCFGCGTKGSIITFIMKYYNVEFQEAMSILAEKANIELPKQEDSVGASNIEALYKLNKLAAQLYMRELHPEHGTPLGMYYLSNRGFIEFSDAVGKKTTGIDLVKKFNLGFAPVEPENWLYAQVVSKFSEDVLEMSGLFQKDSGRDVFHNQIIFPVTDTRNRVVSMSGRYLDNDLVTHKFLNISKTPLYRKNNVLFGLNVTGKDIKEKGFAYVVEGQFDLMRLYSFGYTNTVATMGTEISDIQAKTLSRYTDRALLIRDGDKGGADSIKKISLKLIDNGFAVGVVLLPEGTDPDSFIRHSKITEVKDVLASGKDFIQMWIENISEDSINTPQKVTKKLNQGKSQLNGLKDELTKAIIIREFSHHFKIRAIHLMSDESIVKNMSEKEQKERRVMEIRLKLKELNSLDEESENLLEEHLQLTKELQEI